MTERRVDARGLPCPQPVILTRRALQECDGVITIVDNETAQQNVTRMAQRAGCAVKVEHGEEGICLMITKGEAQTGPAQAAAPVVEGAGGPLVLLVSSELMGRGEDQELGHILMRAFFHTVAEVSPQPDVIILLNSGVKLVVEGSPVLNDLRALAESGIQVLACGTCLGQYGLREKLQVGEVSNMYDIAEALLGADKVVNL